MQIGDRIFLELTKDDVVLPFAKWEKNLRRELDLSDEETMVNSQSSTNEVPSAISDQENASSNVAVSSTMEDDAEYVDDDSDEENWVDCKEGDEKHQRLGVVYWI